MSEYKLEVGDVWENETFETVILEVNGVLAKTLSRKKSSLMFFPMETQGLRDLKLTMFYKGKVKTKPEEWYETIQQ